MAEESLAAPLREERALIIKERRETAGRQGLDKLKRLEGEKESKDRKVLA